MAISRSLANSTATKESTVLGLIYHGCEFNGSLEKLFSWGGSYSEPLASRLASYCRIQYISPNLDNGKLMIKIIG